MLYSSRDPGLPKSPQETFILSFSPIQILAGWCGKFAPFEIKENMVLAPLCRFALDQELLDRLDWLLQAQSYDAASFLTELKGREPWQSGPSLLGSRGAEVDVNRSVALIRLARGGWEE